MDASGGLTLCCCLLSAENSQIWFNLCLWKCRLYKIGYMLLRLCFVYGLNYWVLVFSRVWYMELPNSL